MWFLWCGCVGYVVGAVEVVLVGDGDVEIVGGLFERVDELVHDDFVIC